jgi:hypothetical protein
MMSVARRTAVVTALLSAMVATATAATQESSAPDISRYDRGWHIVRPGENLHFITRKYLGDKLLWQENWKLNPQIEDPDWLEPGQRIQVLIERRDSVPTARLHRLAGRVEGRPAPIPWNPARELDLMLEEDGLRTGSRASTEMEFQDGTRVLMTEDSVVYLRRSGRRLIGLPPKAVEIVAGQAEVAAQRPPGSQQSVEILVGGARAVSLPDEAGVAQTRARRTESAGAKVMIYEGGGEVESGGRTVEVARGMGTSVEPGQPPAPPEALLPAPSGLRPAPGTRLTFTDVELAWQPVDTAAGYAVELCRDADCALLVERRVGLGGTSWRPEPPPPGEYFWRVTAVGASGLDGYPSPAAALALLGGPDRIGPTGRLAISGRQIRFGGRLVVDENVRVEPLLEDAQSGLAGWQPIVDGAEVSLERWRGPWPDGTYELAVRARDEAGNESVIAAGEEIVVDALAPEIAVSGHAVAAAGWPRNDRSRCGWLPRASRRWPSVIQCDWVRRAQRRWLRQGWNWLEVSVDGRRWNPLIAEGSEAAREVARASYRLPAAPATTTVVGADSQILVRSGDGSPLRTPGEDATAAGLRVRAGDAGAGVERMELRVEEAESGVLFLAVEATDALGHSRWLRWRVSAG